MILQLSFYVACWHDDSPNPYRYYGGITSSHSTAEKWLEEAKEKFPNEKWELCSFYD